MTILNPKYPRLSSWNTKISDLVHDFMKFNALKIFEKIHKSRSDTHNEMREIPAIVNEKIVIKC